MSRRAILAVSLAVSATVVLLVGCSPDPADDVSINERIDMFQSDVKANDWGSLYVHIHPDNPKRGQLRSPDAWTPSPFEDGTTWSFSGRNKSGDTVTVEVSSTQTGYNGATWTYTMKKDNSEDGEVWYIDALTSTSGGSPII
jgi:hypothetical protein